MAHQIVFLLGAGRSGTTLLYKLLCLHPEVAYISQLDKLAPSWMPVSLLSRLIAPFPGLKTMAWFEHGGNANFASGMRPWLKRLVPGPSEGEPLYGSCGLPETPAFDYRLSHGTRECLRRRFNRIARLAGGKVLLSKRTSNNQRLLQLREIFPEARFLHLIRDGRAVAYSLAHVDWWNEHQVWWAGRKPRELVDAGENPLAISARNWVKDVRAVQAGLAGLPRERLFELRYESLLKNPLDGLVRALGFLGLPLTRRVEAAVRSLGLGPRPAPWERAWDNTQMDTVMHEQQALLEELGYV